MGGTYSSQSLLVPMPFFRRDKQETFTKTVVPEDVPENTAQKEYKNFQETTTGVTSESEQHGRGIEEKKEDITDDEEEKEDPVEAALAKVEHAMQNPVQVDEVEVKKKRHLRETTDDTGEKLSDSEERPKQKMPQSSNESNPSGSGTSVKKRKRTKENITSTFKMR